MAAYSRTTTDAVKRTSDGACIPADPDNQDFVEYQAWLAAGNAPDPYAPPSEPVPQAISDRQFFQQLAVQGTITQAEALDAVRTGAIPLTLQTFIGTLPSDQKFSAEMLLSGATVFDRGHPMTAALAAGMGWTGQQLDDLWRAAALL